MTSAAEDDLTAFAPAAGLAGIDGPGRPEVISPAQQTGLMERIYGRGDRLVTRFICAHALLALVLATFYQTWLVTGVVTFCAVTLFAVSVSLLPRSFITRCLAGVSLQIFVALHIYQLHGLAEMHFFFFTAFTMLIVYQDWKCMWPGALGLIGQHLGFALLHNAGLGASLFFFEDGYVGFTKLFFHFGIALGQVALCGYWAYLLNRQTLASAVQNAGLRALGERLHRSEGKFRALIEHALDIITIVDADGTIRYESPAVSRVLGYQPDELVGRNLFELVHPEDLGATVAAFTRRQAAAATASARKPTECRYRHHDGTWRTLQAIASAMDAGVGGIVINSRDVTARRRAEGEARRRANQQNATSELARQALAGHDLSPLLASAARLVARTLEVEFCYVGERTEDGQSLRVRAGFGYEPDARAEQLIPTGPLSQGGYTLLVHEPVVVDDLPTETRFPSDRARPAPGRAQRSERRHRRTRARVRRVGHPEHRAAPVYRGRHHFSERGRRHRVRRPGTPPGQRRDACRQGGSRKGQPRQERVPFPHEPRVAHPAQRHPGLRPTARTEASFNRRESESIGHILKAGRHLLGLIDEVLALSRIEAGKMQLSLEAVDLNEVVQECLHLVGRQAEGRRVRCENGCAAAGSGGLYVQADRQRLRQVLLNLLSNAIKYNREGGQVKVACHDGPHRLRLEITDTGQGLTSDNIDHLFMPFERLGAERTATEGTGLGLTVCKALVEAMGGTVGVDSVPGEGSTFWVELPSAVDPRERLGNGLGPAALPVSESQHAGTILYIEDNVSNLRLIEMLLETRPGILLLSAMQGQLGLELARARQPDLILLDLHLPDLPGWDVLSQLQADERTRDIPTVIISADATPGQVARLLEAGACEYLTKPIDVVQLMQTFSEHLHPHGATLALAPCSA